MHDILQTISRFLTQFMLRWYWRHRFGLVLRWKFDGTEQNSEPVPIAKWPHNSKLIIALLLSLPAIV